jgi:hypothetical protein
MRRKTVAATILRKLPKSPPVVSVEITVMRRSDVVERQRNENRLPPIVGHFLRIFLWSLLAKCFGIFLDSYLNVW